MTTVADERRGAGRPRALMLEAVVDAGLELIEREGLSALSIRTLAAQLGVVPRTLYTYVSGKDELLRLMADRFLESAAIDPPRADEVWSDALTRILRDYYRLYVAHPHALDLLLNPGLRSSISTQIIVTNVALLKQAGFDARESLLINRALNRFVLGSAHGERVEQAHTAVESELVEVLAAQVGDIAAISADEIFEKGLSMMLDSLRARAESTRTARQREPLLRA